MEITSDDKKWLDEVESIAENLKKDLAKEIRFSAGVEIALFKENLAELTVARNNYFFAEQTGKNTEKETVDLKIAEAAMESAAEALFRAIQPIIQKIKNILIKEHQNYQREIQLSIFSFIQAISEIYADRELSCFSFAEYTEISAFPDLHFKTHPEDHPPAQDNIKKGSMLEKFRRKTKY